MIASQRSLAIFFLAFACVSLTTYAQTVDVTIVKTINDAILRASGDLLPQAVLWLGSFMAIQFVMTNFALLKSGADIEAVFGKLIGSLAWFGFCIYVLQNGPAFIESVGNGIQNKFTPGIPTATSIVAATLSLAGVILGGVVVLGTSILGNGNQALAGVAATFFFMVLGIGLYMAVKILLLYVELSLIVALAPLSFSLLGLNALKDQGIAPFKSLISLIYRTILLGIVCTAFKQICDDANVAIFALKWSINPLEWGPNFKVIMNYLIGLPILAFIVFKSDSIASTLASGGSSLGTGDIASAAAAGAAAGAAASAVGGGVAGKVAGAIPTGGGGGGSISNASGSGNGGQSPAKPPEPVASVGGAGSSPSSSAPQFSTNKAGAPQPPDTASGQTEPAQSPADAQAAKATEEEIKAESGSSSSSGSGADAGIESSKNDRLNETLDALNANLSRQGKRTFGDQAHAMAQSHAHERSQTNVSISPRDE